MIPISDTRTTNTGSPINKALIALNIIVFILEITAPNTEAFILKYSFIPTAFSFSDIQAYGSILTSIFLHAGLFHLLSNMIFLWVFGDNVEHRMGLLYLPFYLCGGVVASLAQYLIDPTSSIPAIGASGAVAAVLGTYLVLYPNHKVNTLIPVFGFPAIIEIPAPFMLLYWFVTQLFSGIASISQETLGGVAWFAHIGGFAFGYVIGRLVKSNNLRP